MANVAEMRMMEDKAQRIPVELKDIDPSGGIDLTVTRAFSDFFIPEDRLEAVGEMEATIHISASGTDYFVTGRANGRVKGKCSRCLKEYVEELETGIEVPFLHKRALKEDVDGEIEPESADAYYYEGDHLELFDVIRDQLLLALPLKFLCSENCKGLCPNCGADLNVEKCGCSAGKTDSRFEALKQLKDKLTN